MKKEVYCGQDAILVIGSDRLAFSVTTCLLQGGYNVVLCTDDIANAEASIKIHFSDLNHFPNSLFKWEDLTIVDRLPAEGRFCFAIIISSENLEEKRRKIEQVALVFKGVEKLIAINTESISLNDLQKDMAAPERIIGLNWVEPAHNTQFLEIIRSENTDETLLNGFISLVKKYLQKDPYIVFNNGIRSRLMTAMVREANYLIENGYASVEDIDRACRNDAGYYLPFAGNFRYMDLMGTNAYGLVMNDLNSELSKDTEVPEFFKNIINEGNLGMETNKGFYNYEEGDRERWEKMFRKFSYQIQDIINRYPFNYNGK